MMDCVPRSPTTTSQYDEAKIVDLLSRFYRTLEQYGYLHDDFGGDDPPTSINWPPPEGRALDFSELEPEPNELTIDDRVLSLMKKVPTMPDNYMGVAPLLSGTTFVSADDLAQGRQVMRYGHVYAVPPHMLQLFSGQDEAGAVLLDVNENVVRGMDDTTPAHGYPDVDTEPAAEGPYPYPPDLNDWPKVDAPTFLEKMNQKLLDLDWYPTGTPESEGTMVEPVDERLPHTIELRRILKEEYHWPGNDFRRDAWIADCETRMEEIGFER